MIVTFRDEGAELDGVDPTVVGALDDAGRELVAASELEPSAELAEILGRRSGSRLAGKAGVVSAAFGAKTLLGAAAAAAAVVGVEVADVVEVPVVHQIVESIGVERQVPEIDAPISVPASSVPASSVPASSVPASSVTTTTVVVAVGPTPPESPGNSGDVSQGNGPPESPGSPPRGNS